MWRHPHKISCDGKLPAGSWSCSSAMDRTRISAMSPEEAAAAGRQLVDVGRDRTRTRAMAMDVRR